MFLIGFILILAYSLAQLLYIEYREAVLSLSMGIDSHYNVVNFYTTKGDFNIKMEMYVCLMIVLSFMLVVLKYLYIKKIPVEIQLKYIDSVMNSLLFTC